jgi:hypothetical protein
MKKTERKQKKRRWKVLEARLLENGFPRLDHKCVATVMSRALRPRLYLTQGMRHKIRREDDERPGFRFPVQIPAVALHMLHIPTSWLAN